MSHFRRRTALVLVLVLWSGSAIARAQDQPAKPSTGSLPQPDSHSKSIDDPEFQRARELYSAGKMVDAMPLFEKLASTYPNDSGVLEGWGVSILSYSQTLSDTELRRKARIRGRSVLLKAKEAGD